MGESDTQGSGEFQLRNVEGGRLGKDEWVIGVTSGIVADEMGVCDS